MFAADAFGLQNGWIRRTPVRNKTWHCLNCFAVGTNTEALYKNPVEDNGNDWGLPIQSAFFSRERIP